MMASQKSGGKKNGKGGAGGAAMMGGLGGGGGKEATYANRPAEEGMPIGDAYKPYKHKTPWSSIE